MGGGSCWLVTPGGPKWLDVYDAVVAYSSSSALACHEPADQDLQEQHDPPIPCFQWSLVPSIRYRPKLYLSSSTARFLSYHSLSHLTNFQLPTNKASLNTPPKQLSFSHINRQLRSTPLHTSLHTVEHKLNHNGFHRKVRIMLCPAGLRLAARSRNFRCSRWRKC